MTGQTKTLVTQDDWTFKIAQGKKGKWRWQLYNNHLRHVGGSSVKGFHSAEAAEIDLREMVDAMDKKFMQSVFRND